MKLADSAAPRRYDVQHHSLLHFVAQASWPNAAAPGKAPELLPRPLPAELLAGGARINLTLRRVT